MVGRNMRSSTTKGGDQLKEQKEQIYDRGAEASQGGLWDKLGKDPHAPMTFYIRV